MKFQISVVVLLTIATAAGQAVRVCMAVSESDAKTILGASAKRTKDPSGCEWEAADSRSRRMNVARIAVASMFERARQDSIKEGVTKDETGLGGAAFSTIPTSQKGARAAIYMLKDSILLVVDIEGFGPGGAEAHLPQVRDLVRKLGPSVGKE